MKFIFICLLCTTLYLPSIVFSQDTIRLANGEWPPWQSRDLKFSGVASKIVSDAFALEGIRVEYGFFPWGRAYKLSEHGTWDGTFLWSFTEERARDHFYSEPIIATQKVFFHLKSTKFNWITVNDLKDYPIGLTIENTYGQLIEDGIKSKVLKVQYAESDEVNFRKLLLGRIQLFVTAPEVGYRLLYKNFGAAEVEKIVHHPKPLAKRDYHLILSKKVPENERRLKAFNEGLKKLTESGKLDAYLQASQKGEYDQ